MRRPTKIKVEVAETTAEDDPGVDSDTGVTGEQVLPLEPAPRAHPMLSASAETKLEAASDAFLEAEMKADALREIATECEQKEKLAQRLRRLENGDKLKRRKTGFGAAKRSYEAIIINYLAAV